MLLSIYTYVKNGLFNDLHILDMLKHHLPLADEIVVNEGYSTDGTYELIDGLDPKIRVNRTVWEKRQDSFSWYITAKNAARLQCKSQWCLHLDADEFVPEWEFEKMREYIATAKEDLIPLRFVNFYGNYKVYHASPETVSWPARKMILHRNLPTIEFWGDGANIRLNGQPLNWECSPMQFTCHHFGTVRHPARLRQKWHVQGAIYRGIRRWFQFPSFLFNLRPHNWMDAQFLDSLQIYDGPFIKAVRENPAEFTRDDMQLFHHLSAATATMAR
jgi:Glycosyl transferase family 2